LAKLSTFDTAYLFASLPHTAVPQIPEELWVAQVNGEGFCLGFVPSSFSRQLDISPKGFEVLT
jgi:hypothetical protein